MERTRCVGTQTVTINAAFLQEIKDDNEQLRALLKTARNLCEARSPADMRPRHFAALLAKLRDQLAMHFSLEEAYGYFDEPMYVASHLSEQAQSLRSQHGELYEEISGLAEAAANISSANNHLQRPAGYRATPQKFAANISSANNHLQVIRKLAHRVLDFHRRLEDHETQENSLIAEAYNLDIGVGD